MTSLKSALLIATSAAALGMSTAARAGNDSAPLLADRSSGAMRFTQLFDGPTDKKTLRDIERENGPTREKKESAPPPPPPEARREAQPEPKQERKPEPRAEPTPQPKAEGRPDGQREGRGEGRGEGRPDRAQRDQGQRDQGTPNNDQPRQSERERRPPDADQAQPKIINRPPPVEPAAVPTPPAPPAAKAAEPATQPQDQNDQNRDRRRGVTRERDPANAADERRARDGGNVPPAKTEWQRRWNADPNEGANRDRGGDQRRPDPNAGAAPNAPAPGQAQRPDNDRRGRVEGRPRNIDDIKNARRERTEDGGKRVIIEEPGRVIVKQDNKIIIQQDETARLRRAIPNSRFERGRDGRSVTIVDRPGSQQIVTETDDRGQLLRRYRRDRDGRERDIIDNRRRNRFGRDLAVGAGIGVGVVAGAAILNSLVRVPPPRVRIPRDKYIVRYEGASEDDVYEALEAPPVDRIDQRYTLDQVRATPYLRERMRRVDLDDVTFDFGSWEIDPREYRKLERVARAMRRVIQRNPDEVFLVEGYTDAVGSRIDNLTLSDRRAESVADILSREFGVPFENLVTQGYGEDFLKVRTEAPERLNRRTAVRRVTPLIADRSAAPPPPRVYDREPIVDERGGRDDYRGRDDRRDDSYDDRRGSDGYDPRDDDPNWDPRAEPGYDRRY